jgi:conjugal transfer pilus assembly protein TraB
MPNKYKLNINNKCFVVSSGHTNLSAARFYLNMGVLICADSGNRIRYKIRAYIIGKDSKVGIKGKLITKQAATSKKNLIISFKAGQYLTITILKGLYIKYLGK